MLLVLAWLGLLLWIWRIDRRVRAQIDPIHGTKGTEARQADQGKTLRVMVPAGPEERKRREEAERAARERDPDYVRAMQIAAIVRPLLKWALALFALCLVVHVRATAERAAARDAMETCRAWLDGEALQACIAPAQERYMDSAGTSATSEVVLWVIGIL